MSFTDGTTAASDNLAIGGGRMKAQAGSDTLAIGATYYVTFTGNATFTARYRASAASTCTFMASRLILQVLD